VWNQGQVRRGDACAGYWEVNAEQVGRYEFLLRRWPAEAGHVLRAGIEGADVPFRREAIARSEWGMYAGGKALGIDEARMEVDGAAIVATRVAETDGAAVLAAELSAGRHHVRAWFAGANGLMQSPYYVEVRRRPAI
jgi:hypothetical protein